MDLLRSWGLTAQSFISRRVLSHVGPVDAVFPRTLSHRMGPHHSTPTPEITVYKQRERMTQSILLSLCPQTQYGQESFTNKGQDSFHDVLPTEEGRAGDHWIHSREVVPSTISKFPANDPQPPPRNYSNRRAE